MAGNRICVALGMAMVLICVECADAGHKNRNHGHVGKQKVSHLEFYMHDVVLGKNATAIKVAPNKSSDFSGAALPDSLFGSVYVIDDPLTEGPEVTSKLLGKAQGLYTFSSKGEFSLLMALTYSIDSGKYNGSTLSVVGKNAVLSKQRELPIVGGTGQFRLARGYCLAQTHSARGPDAVIGYNVTVFHY